MNSTATKIAAGTSLLGVGGVAGALLAPQQESGRAALPARAQATVVRTVYIKRVHRRVIREKPKPVHHATAAAPAAVPTQVAVAPSAPAASPPLRTRTSATHAPAQQPLRTRTSGSHGKTQTPLRTRTSGGGGEHEHGDD